MFKKILVALDGSACAQSAFTVAESLAKAESAKLVLCTVVDPIEVAGEHAPAVPTDAALAQARAAAEKTLAETAGQARAAGIETETAALSGEPAYEIDRYARDIGADAVVMGTHGRSGLKRLFMGSVAEAVLRAAPCPVIVVHAS
ncbi:MAG TPA: universal stress protein [Candidatus Tyrphobacter sp.]